MARVFSLKHSSTYVGNGDIYSVGRDNVYQIWQIGKTQCFASISWEGLTRETLAKTSCHQPILTLHIPIMCWAYASLRGKASRELPMKTSCFSLCLESSHSLSHTHNPYKKSHIKYRVHKIEHNYNQIWHRIKANTK